MKSGGGRAVAGRVLEMKARRWQAILDYVE